MDSELPQLDSYSPRQPRQRGGSARTTRPPTPHPPSPEASGPTPSSGTSDPSRRPNDRSSGQPPTSARVRKRRRRFSRNPAAPTRRATSSPTASRTPSASSRAGRCRSRPAGWDLSRTVTRRGWRRRTRRRWPRIWRRKRISATVPTRLDAASVRPVVHQAVVVVVSVGVGGVVRRRRSPRAPAAFGRAFAAAGSPKSASFRTPLAWMSTLPV